MSRSVLAIYAVVMSLAGAWLGKSDFVASAEHAALAVWGSVVVAVAALLHALVTHDFNLEYVAHYSQQHPAAAIHDRRPVGRAEGLAAVLAADPDLDHRRSCCCRTATRTAT